MTIQGLSISESDTSVTYNAANIGGVYRFLQRGRFGLAASGGYHYVDFDYTFEDDDSGVQTETNFELTGPYVALQATW